MRQSGRASHVLERDLPSGPTAYVGSMTGADLESPLLPYVPGEVWLKRYPVRFAAMDISARLTLMRLRDGSLMASAR